MSAGGKAAGPPPVQLTTELLIEAAAELKAHGGVLKVYGCPIALADLERMRGGGVQDRKDDLLRLTASQLGDTGIFARLLHQFVQGVRAKRYPVGQPIELMGRTVGAPAPERVIGSPLASGPAIAQGLRATSGGAAFKQSQTHTHEKQLSELVARVLSDGGVTRTAFLPHAAPLERATKHLDAVLVQRIFRDTLRTCPATTALGLDAMRLLSPLADAVELALQQGALESAVAQCAEIAHVIVESARANKAVLAPIVGATGLDLDAELDEIAGVAVAPGGASPAQASPAQASDEGAVHLPECVSRAAALALGVDLTQGQGSFAGAVYRRLMVVPGASLQAAGLMATGAVLSALKKSGVALPAAITQHPLYRGLEAAAPSGTGTPGKAPSSNWPPLKPEEIVLLADRLFDAKAAPADALPGSPAPATRSPARLLLTLRGDWVVRVTLVALCQAALRSGGTLAGSRRQNVDLTHKFLNGIDAASREALLAGLYQMASGDPDQRSRQIGLYFAEQAAAVLKPGLTLGPLRVAFAKYWRQIEATL